MDKESTAGLGLVREDVAEVEVEEDVDRAGDGGGITVEGDEEEEDFEMGDLGAEEEELELEDIVLLSE